MKILVINLDRRPDRWAKIKPQLEAVGIPFERIAATTPETVPLELNEANDRMPLLLRQNSGELACFESHIRALRQIATGTDEWAVILEDDAVLAPSFKRIVQMLPQYLKKASIVRLETSTKKLRLQLPSKRVSEEFTVYGVSEMSGGSGAYIIDREAAHLLLQNAYRFPLPTDHWLFDLQFAKPKGMTIQQLVPAITIQEDLLNGSADLPDSDLHRSRTGRHVAFVIDRPDPAMSLLVKEYTRIKRRLQIVYRRYKAANRVFYRSRKVKIPFEGG